MLVPDSLNLVLSYVEGDRVQILGLTHGRGLDLRCSFSSDSLTPSDAIVHLSQLRQTVDRLILSLVKV
jgi:hypothetical protein